MNKLKTIAVIAVLSSSYGFAQEAALSSGGDASGSGGSISYSIGQVSYTTENGSNGSVAAGVQQAFEISVVGLDEANSNISLLAYPNPTSDYLTLKVETASFSKLNYSLIDLSGQLVSSVEISDNTNMIDLRNLPQSTYLLTISEDQKTIKSFQVIKLK